MNKTLISMAVQSSTDAIVRTDYRIEHVRVAYVPVGSLAAVFSQDHVAGQSVYAALCSIAYNVRPDHKASTGSDKERAKTISKALRTAALEYCGNDGLSPTAGKSISTIARALAVHGLDGILADFDGESNPQFFGKSYIEQRDAAEKTPEDATACLARLAKAWQPHSGSRVAPGSVDAEQVRSLAVACLGALGLRFDDAGFDAAIGPDHRQEKANLRMEIARAVTGGGRLPEAPEPERFPTPADEQTVAA